MQQDIPIGDYLIQRLHDLGVRHAFGIPGDYVLAFFDKLSRSSIRLINTCDEQGAGFAADAYARMKGLGVAVVTYGVGGLKLANTTAEAFAEMSPVVVISGAPGVHERKTHRLLHHKVVDYDTQLKVFQQFTVATAVLDDPKTAVCEIEKALSAALSHKRPVYIELPRDMVAVPALGSCCSPPDQTEATDQAALAEALDEAARMINCSARPVIIVDAEMQRFGLQDDLVRLVEATNIPVASTMMGKSVMAETHPLFLGVYMGAMGGENLRHYVESSDCLILLGVHLTDFNLGMYTSKIDPDSSIHATSHRLSIRRHHYEGVLLPEFVRALIGSGIKRREFVEIPSRQPPQTFEPVAGRPITLQRLFQRLDSLLDEKMIVVSDTGECLWGSLELFVRQRSDFLAPATYGSLGFGVPAAIGAQMASPDLRPVVVVGDGAFQMTGMELSTASRYGLNPIVIIINNQGYGTERPMMDGAFNDIHPWRFDLIPKVLGSGKGLRVFTEDELDDALLEARRFTESFFIVDAAVDPADRSLALLRLAEGTPAGGRQPGE